MKKILLLITIILLLFQMMVLATDIYVGNPAIDRGTVRVSGSTYVDYVSANKTGTITQVQIYVVAGNDLVDCEVAIFYVPGADADNLTTRDTEFIGAVVGGAVRTFDVDLDVEAGDYIGIYFTGGQIETDSSGFLGIFSKAGDWIPCDDVDFAGFAGDAISVYGTGTTVVGWSHKWNTLTISKWNTKEFTKWNGLE